MALGTSGDSSKWLAHESEIRQAVEQASRIGAECSARLYYRSARRLLRQIGVRTPAELYSILKEIYLEDGGGVSFGDHLSIGFGNVDRGRQVRAFVAEHAGEPKDVLAMEYEREYGFSAGIAGIWIDLFSDPADVSLSEWLGGDAEDADRHEGPEDSKPSAVGEFLARELSGDICDAELVRRRFAYEHPGEPDIVDDGQALADAGYYEDHGLLFRTGSTPNEHFTRLIASRPSFSKGDAGFTDVVWRHQTFRYVLRGALENRRVMAYEPDSYISFARLHDVMGVRMSDIESFAAAVCFSVPENAPFTVASLRDTSQVDHALWDLEMPYAFYEGLLDSSGLLRSCTIAGTKVFSAGGEGRMSASSLIDWFVARHEGVERDMLPKLLQRELGIACPAANLATIIHNSSVYHDDVGDAYYSSIDSWKKEARNELA